MMARDRSQLRPARAAGHRDDGRLRAGVVALLLPAWLLAGGASPAATSRYALDLPPGRLLSYAIDLEVRHPGEIVVEAEWTGSRVVSFRLEGPGGISLHRSGPPPQRLELAVVPRDEDEAEPWRLRIRSLPSREHAEGTLNVALPDSPEVRRGVEQAARPPEPPPEPEPWQIPRSAPAGLPAPQARLFESVERFRALAVDGGQPRADACGWQQPLLRYLAGSRDRLASGDARFAPATLRMLAEMADAVRRVDELRTSKDPLLAGPIPEEPRQRRAWKMLRERQIGLIEAELDALHDSLRRGHAPELTREGWPQAFVGCLTASERHFEERVRVGADRAANSEMVELQWAPILAAGQALESLALALER